MARISQDELKKILRYDPDTGYFYKLNHNKGVRCGHFWGANNRAIGIGHVAFAEHYLAFVYMLNIHPKKCSVIHLNGDPSDNRWSNLEHKTLKATELPEYSVWRGMCTRCYNPNSSDYPHWGGRGIKVCDRWLNSFLSFYEDMGSRPSETHSLDRINTLGNYEPGNCRWATAKMQGNNRYDNRIVEYNGIRQTLAQWSDHSGIPSRIIAGRIDKWKWPIDKALYMPITGRGPKFKSEHNTWELKDSLLFQWPE